MANMRAIRNRIKSIESTRQITRSMRMVAAAKLMKAQDAWQRLEDYASVSREVLRRLSAALGETDEPLLRGRGEGPTCFVLLLGNRGLCGAYHTALLKYAQERAGSEKDAFLAVCGRWGREQTAALGLPVKRRFELSDVPEAEEARSIADWLKEQFLSGEAGRVVLLFERYQSALTQEPGELPLLPLAAAEAAGEKQTILFEPDAETLLRRLAEQVLTNTVRAALLEAKTGEHTARMTAMAAASDNTEELIARLSMDLNHARQAAITTEITEIVSGSNALKQQG
ncbi:MAG: ATP synthase F1 subunit gamma [Oscillospiraceae bacterium]|nr:ATP synthase F1 subunit gamma [Oscillospiraceae bacterium]